VRSVAGGPALLLAAGKATRLLGWRESYAKACVPVGAFTPLSFILPRLLAAGYAPVWINLHHHAQQVRSQAISLAGAAPLRFLEEPELLGTGGTLLEVARQEGALPRMVANAKIFTDFDFGSFADAAPGTCVLHPASSLAEFGGLQYDAKGEIVGLAARESAAGSAAVFTGICRPHPAWLPHLAAARAARPNSPACLLRDGLLPALAAGVPHPARLHAGSWCEISTPERLTAAAALLSEMD
jgi:NDP-sugar pyrophosphorylase family protein